MVFEITLYNHTLRIVEYLNVVQPQECKIC